MPPDQEAGIAAMVAAKELQGSPEKLHSCLTILTLFRQAVRDSG
jgi:hypothetical protein